MPTPERVVVPGEGIREHLSNALQIIVGAKASYPYHLHSAHEQSLYADLMAVEYRIQQALTQVENR